MHNPFAMHMLQCPGNLMNILPYLLFRERDFIFLSSFHYEFEISFFGPLYGNEELIKLIVNKPIQIFNDVGVI